MKYLDKSGQEHGSPISAMMSTLKEERKPKVPAFEVIGADIPAPILTPYPEDEANGDLKIDKIVINYGTNQIVSVDEDGQVVTTTPMDDRLAMGVCQEMMDEVLGQAELTEEELKLLGDTAIKNNDRIIADLISAANGKNRLISSQFDHEFIDAASHVINDAWKANPKTARIQGSEFFKKILKGLIDSTDKKLQPKDEAAPTEGE